MQLPLSFHRTFIPERRLIAALLEFAAKRESGTLEEISVATGIPMGRSTGKAPAILDYAKGMGLIELEAGTGRGVKKPVLTDFGHAAFLEDPFLGEPLTQWIAHLQLCRPDIGAVAWYRVFGEGRSVIGSRFTSDQLESYLVAAFGYGQNRTGPLIRTYVDDAALSRALVLRAENEVIIRERAPLLHEYAPAYGAYLLMILEVFFNNQSQVTVADLNEKTHLFDVCLWGTPEIERAFTLIETTGFLSIDRHMRPWIVERKLKAREVWTKIYDELA